MSKKYSILYCDPPWQYYVWSEKGKGRSAENHYKTMPLSEICALPVGSIAAPDCALFLWVTFPNLPEAFTVLNAWGFTYKTVCFVWVKKNKISDSLFWGLGHWTRANAELCLLATKGKPKRVSKSVHQVIMTPIEQHSKKPDEARHRIVQLMGDLPRIELFARTKPDGWDVWGNEVASSIEI
jgi:N6-adenosine-specific RNA methylase IME4